MKTVGTILKDARTAKNLTLEGVEEATRIRKRFLIAIEADEYAKLPSSSYAKGFVKNYSDYLGLNTENVMAYYRRQMREASRASLLPKGVAEPLNPSLLRLTPSRFITLFVIVLIGLFLVYFSVQYQNLRKPPALAIEAPIEGAVVSVDRVDVSGVTDGDATVKINGVTTLVRTDGKFFDQVRLDPGENTITVSATSRYGKSVEEARTVIFTQ